MPIERTKRWRPLYPGDDCTIVFPDTTPDLACTFQGFFGTPEVLVVTTPQGEADPLLQVVHYVDNYNYIDHDVQAATGVGTQGEVDVDVGDNVTIYLRLGPPMVAYTGVVTGSDRLSGAVQMDVGGTTMVFKDWIYLEIN